MSVLTLPQSRCLYSWALDLNWRTISCVMVVTLALVVRPCSRAPDNTWRITTVDASYQPSKESHPHPGAEHLAGVVWPSHDHHCWASLVAEKWRIHLPVQGTQVWPLVQDDPTCHGATQPVSHSYWGCALAPLLFRKRSLCSEKPVLRNQRAAPTLRLEKSLRGNRDPVQPKINTYNYFFKR